MCAITRSVIIIFFSLTLLPVTVAAGTGYITLTTLRAPGFGSSPPHAIIGMGV